MFTNNTAKIKGDALCNSGPPSVDSVDPIDVDLPVSPDSFVVPDCPTYLPEYGPEYGPMPEYGPQYGPTPEYGPLPDPALGQLSVDDTMTGYSTFLSF